jgi:hypothetical protein
MIVFASRVKDVVLLSSTRYASELGSSFLPRDVLLKFVWSTMTTVETCVYMHSHCQMLSELVPSRIRSINMKADISVRA